jgi:transcriptional repressor NF-X1
MQQAFHKILSKDLGAKIRDLQSGQSVSLGHVTLASLGKDGETLDCNEVCLQVERNRALASALGIASPVLDPLEPSLPRYPGILMELARKDPEFASSVETELKSFVEMVMKGSTVQIRRHNFSNMFNKERKLIHELAPFYGCDSLSYGTEPQRYVTISTKKSSAKLPSVSLVAAMDREKFKAAPAPVNLPSERGSSLANISVRALRTSDSEDTGPSKDLETKDGGLPPDYFADDL